MGSSSSDARALQATLRTGSQPAYVVEPEIFLREGPASSYPVVHTVEYGDELLLLERRESWCRVKDKQTLVEGWTLCQLLADEPPVGRQS